MMRERTLPPRSGTGSAVTALVTQDKTRQNNAYGNKSYLIRRSGGFMELALLRMSSFMR
jgi:hypothetical protein